MGRKPTQEEIHEAIQDHTDDHLDEGCWQCGDEPMTSIFYEQCGEWQLCLHDGRWVWAWVQVSPFATERK